MAAAKRTRAKEYYNSEKGQGPYVPTVDMSKVKTIKGKRYNGFTNGIFFINYLQIFFFALI